MKKSFFLAFLILLGVIGWLASGLIDNYWSDRSTEAAERTASKGNSTAELLPRVRTRLIEAQTVPERIILLGSTEAKRRVRLRAQTAAAVAEVLASRGQIVKRGDLVVRLATDDRPARLRQAAALLRQRQTEYKAASSLSKKNLRSKIALAEAEAQLNAAQASLEQIRVDIERTHIRAPFDGVVDQRMVELGDYVKIGEPVATILDLSTIIVAGDVSEHNVAKITPGISGTVVLVDKRELTGQITFVARSSNSSTRTFRVELDVPNPGYEIAEGITAKITLAVGETLSHKLSSAVLTLDDDGVIGVKAVDDDGIVEFLPVTLVADTPDGTWLGGLPRTLRVITVGHEFVRVGQKVEAVPEQPSGT
ncbi:MAG TPA: efflux RND transporter periplasmic adaptor subunit [Gammaproteobacteria bacterium]|jgi:multidrug efflux system membrane fusion protein|nr:efflux RND transporter periplasmic adaptor subunit [Arenicellales bacterium]HCV20206.1 efflux RND transporter periplasmic adaptor subunit [Gammaproteobacteria bacterium]MDP6313521.1 efflux RND transporter periplasmic adaptor subunit [Arenicellales bacterium]MDP7120173.1 efflux RND transporter periplasmic adaptor subunit [Arenicellales bacterium]MDP7192318.1 efflux RND transporter periplasmic adaptor subunit [Arenicellales bacterium]